MHTKISKLICVVAALALLTVSLTSCDFSLESFFNQDNEPEPVAVSLKTDLKDAKFTFTYGQLKEVLPADLLATLFENYDEKTDDVTIELNYNDLKSRYSGDEELYQKVLALLTDSDRAALAANQAQVLDYYTQIVNQIKQQKPATAYSENFWVDDGTIEFTKDGVTSDSDSTIAKAAKLFKDFAMQGVEKALPNTENNKTNEGDDLTDILYLKGTDKVSELTMDDIDVLYSSVTPTTELNSKEEPVVTALTRTVEIHLKADKASVEKAITFRDKTDILSKINQPQNSFTVDNYDFTCEGCVITATFNAVTDELLSLSYDKNMQVTASVTGEGSLESLGNQTLQFNCGSNMYYQFGWASEAE